MIEILKKWNPWWVEKEISKTKTQIKRQTILEDLNKLMRVKEALVLVGVRRSGKSTLMYQLMNDLIVLEKVNPNNILYFNFDETLETKDYKAFDDVYNHFLELNNSKGKKYVFFDEIQNIDQWEVWIKKTYDLYNEEIKFVLSGSNNSMLHDNLSKLLTGRIITREIYPLSFREYLHFKDFIIKDFDLQKNEIMHNLNNYTITGGFPEVVLEKDIDINAARLNEYFNSILLRDIVQTKNIREVSKLMDLSKYCMTNISSIFSYNKISKAVGLNISSLKEYMFFLENAYLVFQLKYFSYSLKESIAIQKPRKVYCIDNGLRNAISFKFSSDDGKLAENLVFIELKRRNLDFYYWKEKGEVDFVIKNKDNSLTIINVSYTDKINEREFKSISEFEDNFSRTKINFIILTKNIEKAENKLNCIPLWKWLLQN